MVAKILLVDDDAGWRSTLTDTLRREGFVITGVATGGEALAQIAANQFDLLILDVQLPDMDGVNVCAAIRQRSTYVPIIMISGVKKELIDQVVGLRVGADRYFEKPTELAILVAQIHALLRMSHAIQASQGANTSEWLEVDAYLRINLKRRTVMAGGKVVDLTAQQFDLLAYLVKNAGKPCPRDDIIDQVWSGANSDGVSNASVDVTISRLRQKIEPIPDKPQYILTVHGWGYKFRGL